MSPSLLLVATLPAHAACPPPTFTFVGQPACVTVDFAGDHTLLTSACDGPLLVDRSVTLGSLEVVLPGETATLRDLSAFTVGLDGELHRVVATVDPPTCEVAAAALPERADAAVAATPAAMLRVIAAPFVAWAW